MGSSIVQRCLFITSTRLGDAVLSTGALQALHERHPDAAITVVCGPVAASIFEACPFVDKVIAIRKKKRAGHWIDLWAMLWKTRWTTIVDLRNSLVSRLFWAEERFIARGSGDIDTHKIIHLQNIMKLGAPPAPRLWLPSDTLIAPGAPVLALGPAANWHGKTWPAERFIELTQRLLAGPCAGWRVAIFAAANERDQVHSILDAFPNAIDGVGKGTPAQVAAALAKCAAFIGNDSGLMHMAAAVGVKTLGLFGPSRDAVYAPWGGHVLRTPESYDELISAPDYSSATCGCLMESLGVEAAYAAASSMIRD